MTVHCEDCEGAKTRQPKHSYGYIGFLMYYRVLIEMFIQTEMFSQTEMLIQTDIKIILNGTELTGPLKLLFGHR